VIVDEDDGALSLVEKDGDKFKTRRIRSGKHDNPWYPNGLPPEVCAFAVSGTVLILVTLGMAVRVWFLPSDLEQVLDEVKRLQAGASRRS
jgi:hypothetical protein